MEPGNSIANSNRWKIARKNGSNMLYVTGRYFGKRIEKSSRLPDTLENRAVLNQLLDRIMRDIANSTFKFAEAFPCAKEEEKKYFAEREGWAYRPQPHQVFVSDYVQHWRDNILSTSHSEGKKRDFEQALDCRIIPFLGTKTFFQFNRVEVEKFINGLKHLRGKKRGKRLSRKSIQNIMIPLRAIWEDACDEYRWDMPDPFGKKDKHLPHAEKVQREVFRFDDWIDLLKHLDPHYKGAAEVMIMTGLIASELAGLRKEDIEGDYLIIRNSIVRAHEKDELKNVYRKRKIFITKALQERLDEAVCQATGPYLFTTKTGATFREGSFRQNYWKPALEVAGQSYKVPYSIRHSFAAWSLTMGMDPNRLVSLMGHGSKKMVYEEYGHYTEGLEEDREKMVAYFGPDFLNRKNKRHPSAAAKEWRKNGESRHLRLVK